MDYLRFEGRIQASGEPFDEFYIFLRDLARVAELCTDCRDWRIVARIQAGLNDWEVAMRPSEHDDFPTLAETIDFCRKAETAQQSNLKSSQPVIRKTSKQPPKLRTPSES